MNSTRTNIFWSITIYFFNLWICAGGLICPHISQILIHFLCQSRIKGIKGWDKKQLFWNRRGHKRTFLDLWTSVYLGKVTISLYQCNRWISLCDVHIHDDMHNILSMCISPAKTAKFASYRRWNATERIFRWHDLESRSQVKQRSWEVQSWDFQGRCKFWQIRYT